MIEVIPAIIPRSFKDLEEKVSLVEGLVPLVQIDIMDGKLTPEASWPYLNSEDPDFLSIKKEDKEFPFWEKVDFEVDLMAEKPENIWFDWIIAGAKRIIFHFESTEDFGKLIYDFKSKLVSKESVLYIEAGMAVNIDTPNEAIYPFSSDIDFVQFMGIEKIGFGGQPFNERVIQKIKLFKEHFPKTPISVDGGVSLDSASRLVEAGATRLVSGSAILKSENIVETIRKFQNLG